MKKSPTIKSLQDLEFVFESGKASIFGHRFISNKRFREALKKTEDALLNEIKGSREIEANASNIIDSAKREAEDLLDGAEEYLKNLDVIKEAQLYATEIIEEAKLKSGEIIQEGEMIRDNAIEHGQDVKNKLINQGYKYVEERIALGLKGLEESKKDLEKSYDEMTSILSNSKENESRNVHSERKIS